MLFVIGWDKAILGWKAWIWEDPSTHPYRWLRPDLVPPSPFLQCDPGDTALVMCWLMLFGRRSLLLVVWMVGVGRSLRPFPPWFGLARILRLVEETGVWPDGLLDAFVAMIPKSGWDAAPLGQRPLCVLPVVYRVWASARMMQLEPWFKSWVPSSVYSAGGGRGSVDAWFSSALDIEECLSGGVDSDVHLFVADVVKSFDTVDTGVLDRVFSSLGLPAWFRHVYFQYHACVRLRFKFAVGLGESWTRDAGIPQGCPLSMMFIVALYLPWCRYLDQMPDVSLSYMRIISSVLVVGQSSYSGQLSLPLHMLGWLGRSLLPLSAFL